MGLFDLLNDDEQKPIGTPPPTMAPPPAVPFQSPHAKLIQGAAPAPMPPIPSAAPATKLPGMPPSISPDELESYLGKQRQSLNKYGPEDQMKLEDDTLADRNSLSSRATSGLKGFGDALMMGVADAGNPGWQKDYEDRQDRMAREKMDVMKNANEGNLKRTEGNMSLDKMDAKSPLSKAAQDTYAPLFQKLGYPEQAIHSMSASGIENAIQLMSTYGGKEKEAAVQQFQAELTAAENQRHNREMESVAKSGEEQKGLEALSKVPWYSRILHPGITNAMESQAGMTPATPSFASEQEAAAAGLPDGSAVIIGGKKGTWRHK